MPEGTVWGGNHVGFCIGRIGLDTMVLLGKGLHSLASSQVLGRFS